MLEVLHCCYVVVVHLKLNIWIDVRQRCLGCLHLTQTRLVWFEEQAIHVGQLHFVIVKQNKLCITQIVEWE